MDRRFKGDIAKQMENLTTRALQTQVEAAVSSFSNDLFLSVLIFISRRTSTVKTATRSSRNRVLSRLQRLRPQPKTPKLTPTHTAQSPPPKLPPNLAKSKQRPKQKPLVSSPRQKQMLSVCVPKQMQTSEISLPRRCNYVVSTLRRLEGMGIGRFSFLLGKVEDVLEMRWR